MSARDHSALARTYRFVGAFILPCLLLVGCPPADPQKAPKPQELVQLNDAFTPIEQLGELLFDDPALSTPPGQSCAACHADEAGYAGPDSLINEAHGIIPGVVHTRSGNRKIPTAAYAGDSPVLHYDEEEEAWVGGMFWDGRATGWILGDPLAEQAMGPFLNPLEQNMPQARLVVRRVAKGPYAALFEEVWGPGSLDYVHDVAGTYERIAFSIAAYERSEHVNPFDSKYDYYLKGEAELSGQEALGLELFEGKAMCSQCHPSQPGPNGEPPLFTDFTYDNLGVPRNPRNPFYTMPPHWNPEREAWVDLGLGGFLMSEGYPPEVYEPELGKMKVPTLRNVDMRPYPEFVKAYTHNGFFSSLEGVVNFYNTRDVAPWPPPEVPMNVNSEELGDLGLTAEEVSALVAFLKTLTDDWTPPAE
jgi:cytochrome c peroxidase